MRIGTLSKIIVTWLTMIGIWFVVFLVFIVLSPQSENGLYIAVGMVLVLFLLSSPIWAWLWVRQRNKRMKIKMDADTSAEDELKQKLEQKENAEYARAKQAIDEKNRIELLEQVRIEAIREQNRVYDEWSKRDTQARGKIRSAIHNHLGALSKNLELAVKHNDYGSVIEDNSILVVKEFFQSIQLTYVTTDENFVEGTTIRDGKIVADIDFYDAVVFLHEELARAKQDAANHGFDPSLLPPGGHDFETWVSSALKSYGWNSRVTQASGDQGIDVIASKNGISLGLQCKLYTSKVGNKAIQEAHAGQIFYGLDRSAVMTNAEFTNSAKELATRTGVLTLSVHDIPKLDQIINS